LNDDAYEAAPEILSVHRDHLERVAQELMKRETLDEHDFNAVPEDTGRLPKSTSRAIPRTTAMDKWSWIETWTREDHRNPFDMAGLSD